MNKIFVISQTLLLILLLIFAGCRNKQPKDNLAGPVKNDSATIVKHDTLQIPPTVLPTRSCCTKITSATMNNVYMGVDNPLLVESQDDVTVSCSNGTITFSQSTKQYFLRVGNGTETTVKVTSANDTSCHSSQVFRIKRIPDPVAYVSNIKGSGYMDRSDLQVLKRVFVRLENFELDVKFTVFSFVMSTVVNGVWVEYRASGSEITDEMQRLLIGSRAGNKILFDDITVQGSDGSARKIPGVVIKVK